MSDKITTIKQLNDLLSSSCAQIQNDLIKLSLDYETRTMIDNVAKEYCYVFSGIIEYLENQE